MVLLSLAYSRVSTYTGRSNETSIRFAWFIDEIEQSGSMVAEGSPPPLPEARVR